MRCLAYLTLVLGLAAIAAPAHASLNDQFVCATGDERMIEVTIMATEPGTALLSQRASEAADQRQTTLTGAPPARVFRFDGKGARFMGNDALGVLFLGSERLICRFPGDPDAPAPDGDLAPAQVMGDGEGLLVRRYDTGEDARFDFGTPRSELVGALGSALGQPGPLVANEECGAGPMEFQRFGPLEVNFQDGAFVGWSIQAAREPRPAATISLADGTQPGDPADGVTERYGRFEGSTLGAEYHSDGITALIDEASGTVDLLMGGTNCVFR